MRKDSWTEGAEEGARKVGDGDRCVSSSFGYGSVDCTDRRYGRCDGEGCDDDRAWKSSRYDYLLGFLFGGLCLAGLLNKGAVGQSRPKHTTRGLWLELLQGVAQPGVAELLRRRIPYRTAGTVNTCSKGE